MVYPLTRQQNSDRIRKLYSNQGLWDGAELCANVDVPFAIDYLEQAPVLGLVATFGGTLTRRTERARIAQWFGSAVHGGKRLKAVLALYKIPYPMRKIMGRALVPSQYDAILQLSKLDPSTLAQIIPATSAAQRRWLLALRDWCDATEQRGKPNGYLFRWAACAFTRVEHRQKTYVSDLADFACSQPLNEKWSLQQAMAAQEEWHTLLAKERGQKEFFAQFRIGFSDILDYAPFPTEHHIGNYSFHALNSGEELFREGIAMRHCVSTYSAKVIHGQERIFSIREGATRRATAEYAFSKGRYRLLQIKGPCNARPAKPIVAAAQIFELVGKKL